MNPVWLLSGFMGNETHWGEAHELLEKHLGYTVEWYDWAKDCKGVKSLYEAAQVVAQRALSSGQRPALVGYSMGGRLVLEAITQFPGSFEQAILVSTHLGFENDIDKNERLVSDKKWAQLMLEDLELFKKKWSEQEVFKGTKQNISDFDPKLWSQLLVDLSTATQRNFSEVLNQPPKSPLLFMSGERDEKFKQMTEKLPEFINRVVIEKAGHRIPLDNPQSFAENAAHFIRTQWEKL